MRRLECGIGAGLLVLLLAGCGREEEDAPATVVRPRRAPPVSAPRPPVEAAPVPAPRPVDPAPVEAVAPPATPPVPEASPPEPVKAEEPPPAPAPEPASPPPAPPEPPKEPEKPPPPPVLPLAARVDRAIGRGVGFLKSRAAALPVYYEGDPYVCRTEELVLWTFVHAGVPEADPDFDRLLKKMLDAPLERTYGVALQAMILEELDRAKHQRRIAQCAQFLLDNQCANGQWAYGDPSVFVDEIPQLPKSTATAPARPKPGAPPPPGTRIKPEVRIRIKVQARRTGPEKGDNSNSQYAALGLRACHDAGIVLPREATERAIAWWRSSQKADSAAKVERLELDGEPPRLFRGTTVAAQTVTAAPQGWCYEDHSDHAAYGSMTAGAVGSLCIYDYILDPKGSGWRKDKHVHRGLQWMARRFTVTANPGRYEFGGGEDTREQYYYYLYALERAAILYGTERLGARRWYPEGAEVLVAEQGEDGSWNATEPVADTCFAILFLRRATLPLVASVDRK